MNDERNDMLCLISNGAPHYRLGIFKLIDDAFSCDYIFGDLKDIRQMETSVLHGHVEHVCHKRFRGGWYWQPGVVKSLWKKPCSVYIHQGEARCLSGWVFLLLARLFFPRKRVFLWSHGWYGKESRLEAFVKRIMFRLPNGGTFVYGHHARNLMVREGLRAEKLFVIHNSLGKVASREALHLSDIYRTRFGNNEKVIISIGRLNERKQLPLLIEAVHQLRQEGKYYNLVLVGDGSDRKRLEGLVNQYGLQKQVWFYGACYDEQTNAELIYNADLCVIPGDIGLTAVHCMSYGTPCISHDEYKYQGPEFEAIQKGVTGDFFTWGSVEALRSSILHWFLAHPDREAVRKACYAEVDAQWTPQFQINVIKEALKARQDTLHRKHRVC